LQRASYAAHLRGHGNILPRFGEQKTLFAANLRE